MCISFRLLVKTLSIKVFDANLVGNVIFGINPNCVINSYKYINEDYCEFVADQYLYHNKCKPFYVVCHLKVLKICYKSN